MAQGHFHYTRCNMYSSCCICLEIQHCIKLLYKHLSLHYWSRFKFLEYNLK